MNITALITVLLSFILGYSCHNLFNNRKIPLTAAAEVPIIAASDKHILLNTKAEAKTHESSQNNIQQTTSTIVNENGELISEKYQSLQQQDLAWGYTMQHQLRDFIATHYHANDINVINVTCKRQQCELLLVVHEIASWQIISNELRQQPWWQFHASHSHAGNYPDSKKSTAIYLFLSW